MRVKPYQGLYANFKDFVIPGSENYRKAEGDGFISIKY